MLIFIRNETLTKPIVESIKNLADSAKVATCVDIIVTINGKQFHAQGNWMKNMRVPEREPETLREKPTVKTHNNIGVIGSPIGQGCGTFNVASPPAPPKNCERCNSKISLTSGRCDVCGL